MSTFALVVIVFTACILLVALLRAAWKESDQ